MAWLTQVRRYVYVDLNEDIRGDSWPARLSGSVSGRVVDKESHAPFPNNTNDLTFALRWNGVWAGAAQRASVADHANGVGAAPGNATDIQRCSRNGNLRRDLAQCSYKSYPAVTAAI
jgi:hypothetical protein